MKLAPRLFLLNGMLIANIGAGADFAAGLEAYSIGDYEAALAEWAPLAEQGHAGSQFGLGSLYANGWGVPLDDAKALEWYERAANQGHAEAAYNIGVMYQNGWGVEQSDAEALRWIQMSAEGGHAPAHRALGDMYAGGIGVVADPVQACKWFATGEALGDSESSFDRSELEMNMQATEISAAAELAKVWLEEFRIRHPDYVWPDE
jgi:TPR repeat protein